ncbi:PREDICTED: protein VTE6, chloroplastic [Tarenaya hassleriana]|uniref:protein VTE6, chloroplastic n=1 Tax=Tarenaya hassleriana TaxID=28532 RepID=UPI00053C0BB2|nr:PREDICTED: protein VTE6, chloroplastic [Tarenaya hassleriana]
MALISSTLLRINLSPILPLRFPKFTGVSSSSQSLNSSRFGSSKFKPLSVGANGMFPASRADGGSAAAVSSLQGAVTEAMNLIQAAPPTWKSAVVNNLLIFVLGSPILVTGLSASGIAAAFLLGTLTWRAFGSPGFLLVAAYFVIGTAATKVKMSQKEAQGVAEKRKGRRGPGSVIGSSAAGCVCAFLSIYQVGGAAVSQLLQLGFVSSFCTKVSDTVSSEIGKAYGKTTYLATTFKVVPRGTEGAVSVEGTLAGLIASLLLASIGCFLGQITPPEVGVCVLASQIANFGESIIGATLQDKKGFKWLNNDLVNVINISLGSIVAISMQQFLLHNWIK